jgi:hypothetical protein
MDYGMERLLENGRNKSTLARAVDISEKEWPSKNLGADATAVSGLEGSNPTTISNLHVPSTNLLQDELKSVLILVYQ